MTRHVYCHGLPGGAAELDFAGIALPVLDRNAADLPGLAARLPEAPVHLVGFSLGAALALRLAAHAPHQIAALTLVSAAAPLEMGDFLPRMAGRDIFRLARRPALFRAVTRGQALLAATAPALLAAQLRATCDPADKALLNGPTFIRCLQEGYGPNRAAHLHEIPAYVRAWADQLARVTCPVTLHHGTADRWAPLAMSEALAAALPQARLIRHEGAGHYTTLAPALRNVRP